MRTNILLLKISSYLFTLLILCSSNIDSQTLTAEQIYKKITDAVVVIHAYDYNNELTKQGSGVVINDKGYVVTNYHVLSGCERLEILHNKDNVPYVDIIGIDVVKDILILKIEAKKFPAIKIGDSKSLKIGQRVYALGSPLGYENTISEGIISGLRSYEEYEKNYIQITASISPGSSGGAVVNDGGELIGISTLTAKEGQNLNFAIPIEEVLKVKISSYRNDEKFKLFDLFSMGYTAFERRNYNEAIKYFTQHIDNFPSDADAYGYRATSNYMLRDYIAAKQDYDKAIDLSPNDCINYINRGALKGEILKDYKGAIQDLNIAIELNPNLAAAFYNRGVNKERLKDYRGSIQDYSKAIGLDSQYANAYLNRGCAKNELGDSRGAIQDYNKTIEIVPDEALAYYNRGIAKHRLGDKYGACMDWSKAGELGYGGAYDLIREECN